MAAQQTDITPEMIKAGVATLKGMKGAKPERLVEDIYRAMEEMEGAEEPAEPASPPGGPPGGMPGMAGSRILTG